MPLEGHRADVHAQQPVREREQRGRVEIVAEHLHGSIVTVKDTGFGQESVSASLPASADARLRRGWPLRRRARRQSARLSYRG